MELFSNAEQMWKLKKTGYGAKCRADLYNVLYTLQNEYHISYIQKDKSNLIRPAVDYIKENYFESTIRISHLASLCNISEAYFRSLFLKINGTSPIRYINNLKILRAKELILSGDYTIHDIARLSGFSDDSYFSRKFKKHTGFSPAEFKKINH
jgi:AraC-like DNA-binding protein